jgi:tetratricopeptide (TPR) repeat protein
MAFFPLQLSVAIGLVAAFALGCAKSPGRGVTAPPPAETAAPPVEASAPPTEPAPIADEAEPEPIVTQADPEPTPIAEPAPSPKALGSGRDPRPLASQQRPREYLVAEIQALERLFAATSKTAPDRAFVLRRLAENYVELGYAAQRFNDSTGPKVVVAARKKAIEHYRRLRSEYPTFEKLDEVLYYLGYEYERGGDLANARAMYRQLVSEFPSSAYVAKIPKSLRPR